MHLPAVHTLALALAAACAYAGAALAIDDRAVARPLLAGSWSFNASLSTPKGSLAGPEGREPADAPVQRGTGGGGPGDAGPGVPGLPIGASRGRGRMSGGGGSGPPPRGSREGSHALVEELLQLPPRWSIAQDGDRLSFRDPHGATRVYVANGKSEKHQLRNGTIETKSRWDGDALVMELKAGGLTVTRRFTVRGDPRQLEVVTRHDGGPKDAPQLTVYDAADGREGVSAD